MKFSLKTIRQTAAFTVATAMYLPNLVAAESGMTKFRNFTPAQIERMPQEQRSSEVPIAYIWAAQKGLSLGKELIFSRELNLLMYGGVGDYKKAVKDFQKDLNDPPTGELTVSQIHQLTKRSEMQIMGTPSILEKFESRKIGGFATVRGTMVILDEKIAWPINLHNVQCIQSLGTCSVRQVAIWTPNETSFSQTLTIFEDQSGTYEITKWEKDVIEARSDSSGCREESVTLNFKLQEFFFITRNGSKPCESLGVKIPPLQKPRIAQLIDGKDVISKEFNRMKEAAFKVTSSRFQRQVKDLIKDAETAAQSERK